MFSKALFYGHHNRSFRFHSNSVLINQERKIKWPLATRQDYPFLSKLNHPYGSIQVEVHWPSASRLSGSLSLLWSLFPAALWITSDSAVKIRSLQMFSQNWNESKRFSAVLSGLQTVRLLPKRYPSDHKWACHLALSPRHNQASLLHDSLYPNNVVLQLCQRREALAYIRGFRCLCVENRQILPQWND